MLNKLTQEQEKGIIEWREHCLKIGRDTSPINKELVERSWIKFYQMLNKEKPLFWYCQSPLQAQIIINIFPEIQKIINIDKGTNIKANIGNNIRTNIKANIWDNIWANIKANIWANIWDNIRDNIWDNIRDNIWDNIRDNIWANIKANIGANIWDNIKANIGNNIRTNIKANIWDNIWANIGANIKANIWDNIRDNIWDNIWDNIKKLNFQYIDTYSWCQHNINWIAYYKYFEKYGLLPYDKNFKILDIWYDLACSCGWCYTFENMVFVCEKPSKLYLNAQGQLHKDGSMALEYSDGYGLWILNGISVPKWLVETKAEKINPKLALTETNADIQREIIRKVGAERILKCCNAKTLDDWNDPNTGYNYKLMDMSIGERIRRKYLYFEHASMKGVFYAKPVPPETKKALHARAWMLSMVERDALKNIDQATEAEILANLPLTVS